MHESWTCKLSRYSWRVRVTLCIQWPMTQYAYQTTISELRASCMSPHLWLRWWRPSWKLTGLHQSQVSRPGTLWTTSLVSLVNTPPCSLEHLNCNLTYPASLKDLQEHSALRQVHDHIDSTLSLISAAVNIAVRDRHYTIASKKFQAISMFHDLDTVTSLQAWVGPSTASTSHILTSVLSSAIPLHVCVVLISVEFGPRQPTRNIRYHSSSSFTPIFNTALFLLLWTYRTFLADSETSFN